MSTTDFTLGEIDGLDRIINAARPRVQAVMQDAEQEIARFNAHIQMNTLIRAFVAGYLFCKESRAEEQAEFAAEKAIRDAMPPGVEP